MEEENLLGDSRRWCLHARPPVVSKLTGFQDSEPGVDFGLFGAVTWAGRRCRRLSWVHRPRTTGPARAWLSRRKAQGGAARSAARTRPCAPWRTGTAGYGRGISDEGEGKTDDRLTARWSTDLRRAASA